MNAPKPRVRRSREESRQLILESAEALLRESGPEGVNVRAVGARIGLTDAAVSHHFGTRDALLEALLHHAGRQLRDALNEALSRWRTADATIEDLVGAMADVYADGRYAELALRLYEAGWRDKREGMLSDVVDVLHTARVRAAGRPLPVADTRFAVALLHQTLALDPLFGREFRRSAGMPKADEPSLTEKKRLWSAAWRAILMAGTR